MGRKKKEIDKKQFEQLCALQCIKDEICAVFDVDEKTLTAWCKRTYKKSFREIFQEKRKLGHISLRRTQFKWAEKSATMAIFLGKQYLGQSDNATVGNAAANDTDAPVMSPMEQLVKSLNDSRNGDGGK